MNTDWKIEMSSSSAWDCRCLATCENGCFKGSSGETCVSFYMAQSPGLGRVSPSPGSLDLLSLISVALALWASRSCPIGSLPWKSSSLNRWPCYCPLCFSGAFAGSCCHLHVLLQGQVLQILVFKWRQKSSLLLFLSMPEQTRNRKINLRTIIWEELEIISIFLDIWE